MFRKRLKFLYYLLLTLSLSGCGFSSTSHYEAVGDTNHLEGLTKLHAVQKQATEKSSNILRLQSIRDYAFSLGAQAGCAERTRQLQQLLSALDKVLDRVYSFSVWMLPNNVLPPVLIEANQTVSLTDAQTMRIAGRTYHIYKDARFVSTPPHWRYDYLLRDASHMTDQSFKLVVDLLPKNAKEQAVWKEAVKRGWQCGIEQARHNFIINLQTLARDLEGMVLYRQLLAKGIVSAPYVAHTHLGVTGDEKNMHVHDQVFRITTLSKLQHDTNMWQPVMNGIEVSDERSTTSSAE